MAPASTSRRNHELDAAFDSSSETSGLPGYNELSESSRGSVAIDMSSTNDIFFDAGDALPEQPNHSSSAPAATRPPSTSSVAIIDPLGANAPNPALSGAYDPPTPRGVSTYDFERPSYFPSTTRRPPSNRASSSHAPRAPSGLSPGASQHGRGASSDRDANGDDDDDDNPNELHLGFADEDRGRSTHGQYGLLGGGQDLSRIDRARLALGRFGRLVGMGFPGARYETVSRGGPNAMGHPHRPRVMGGGIGQDGVFANLNAKPERNRRAGAAGPDDRGDDDDLAEETLPPTYEIAAADATPPYWETTILGTASGLHPLANGLGWTPGAAHVGAVEDLIVDGLPLGNLFGFAWNMLVSMTFQFVGFLLTYLLHTSHAARCGSRAGLGITLIQYGFYLNTRASEIAEGKVGGSGDFQGGSWFGEEFDDQVARRSASVSGFVSRALLGLRSSDPPTATIANGSTLADAFAAQGEAVQSQQDLQDSMSASTEWFSYILMMVGWLILLSSLLSYWRLYRWGQSLVDAARREQAAEESTTADGETAERAPVGFVHRFRAAFSRSGGAEAGRQHSAEDWVIFPGMGRRLGTIGGGGMGAEGARRSTSLRDLEDGDGLDAEEADLNPSERRLLRNMRSAGLVH